MNREDDFLSRWSRRKHAARKGDALPGAEPALPSAAAMPVTGASSSPAAPEPGKDPKPLPPLESLTAESDFSPFMNKDVDPGLRRQALKTLFRDPRHNVMDGLDVYIDDFSKPDPIPPEWLGKLNQMAHLGDYKPPEAKSDAEEAPAEEAGAGPIATQDQGIEEQMAPSQTSTSGTGPPEQESKHS
jgi:hypothetical protein